MNSSQLTNKIREEEADSLLKYIQEENGQVIIDLKKIMNSFYFEF